MTESSAADISFGDRRLVGQERAREQIERIVRSGRVHHAYLFSGPRGVGKTAFALAFAEWINGVDHLTDLKGEAFSKKSSWFTHPDIHVFLPVPTTHSVEELRSRLQLLKEDPYEIVDFSLRPSLADQEASKNRQAFYPIKYFREEIRPKAYLKPNEGEKTVVVLTEVEQMRVESANAFLKLLEEPSEDLIFLLTTAHSESLLPTILSRCHHLQLRPLKTGEIEQALIERDGVPREEARYLARVSGGNYAMTRFFDMASLRETREAVIEFLRRAYVMDAVAVSRTAQEWQSENNVEGVLAILNVMEVLLRDLLVYRNTGADTLVTNADQIEVIRDFSDSLPAARLEDMIEEIGRLKPMAYRYVQPKLIFTVLSLRFARLMRGEDPAIDEQEPWRHLPAYSD